MSEKFAGEKKFAIHSVNSDGIVEKEDILAVEEPLEIRVVFGPSEKRTGKSLSITMRTPGNDSELAAGFLFTEGIIQSPGQIESFEKVGPVAEGDSEPNTIRVNLADGFDIDYKKLQRHFYTTSSCGVCGKASLEALEALEIPAIASELTIQSRLIHHLPNRLREVQKVFHSTGGIHAAGLFSTDGELVSLREDVGRHNAIDKLIGEQLIAGNVPVSNQVMVVSGRASFELLQKTLMASVPVLVAVGAPSSLAVELARKFEMTLIGFTSAERFNIYSGKDRVI